ncbi:hypothetical protein [Pseudomonas viridiflava]|uniref:hypothetical protein n=1 Tax=Pseudomonas viridiflava TaxID=33069 RepID=UPI000F035D40|nr:hypothetical protein [Pseudomonas viridiflava]
MLDKPKGGYVDLTKPRHKMINLLSVASHKAKYSIDFYPTFAIDGVPIEVWLPRQNRMQSFTSFPHTPVCTAMKIPR